MGSTLRRSWYLNSHQVYANDGSFALPEFCVLPQLAARAHPGGSRSELRDLPDSSSESFGYAPRRDMGEQLSGTWQYDLFEVDDGYPIWCTQAMGPMYAGFTLRQLSANSSNECYAVRKGTNEVVARLNIPATDSRAPHVFQVAYDLKIADALAHELPCHGYRFGYAAGNDLSFAVLTTPIDCDAFILGCAAAIDARRGMADWLNANYPDAPIIALKSPSEPDLAAARFNLELDGDGALLPTLAQALHPGRPGE